MQKAHAPQNLVFYLGCWDSVPVATGMFVRGSGSVGIHRIGTLPEFRKRGIGTAVTYLPLHEFKKQGINQALLLASSSGYSLYEKMGFKKLLTYDVYTKKVSIIYLFYHRYTHQQLFQEQQEVQHLWQAQCYENLEYQIYYQVHLVHVCVT